MVFVNTQSAEEVARILVWSALRSLVQVIRLTLSQHLNWLSKGTPRLAMDTMRMSRGNNIRTSFMDLGMNEETRLVHRQLSSTLNDESILIQEDQIRGLDGREMLRKRVHPEVILQDGV